MAKEVAVTPARHQWLREHPPSSPSTKSTGIRKYLIIFEKPVSSLTPIELSDKQGAAEASRCASRRPRPLDRALLLRTEVHTFAFSVAANAILSFFPFLLLLMTLIRYVFHSQVMYGVVENLLRDYTSYRPGICDSKPERAGRRRTSARRYFRWSCC